MSDWKKRYDSILCTADEAVRAVNNGDRVLIAGVAGRPERLVKALIDNAQSYRDVKIMHGLSNGGEDYCDEKYKDNFIHESLFASKNTRKAIEEGRAKIYPCYYYELGYWFEEGTIPVNVFMFQVTPPDEFGFCSCGLIADFIQEGVDCADIVIAQVNENLPWCSSQECLVHVDRIDYIVEYNDPLPVIERKPIGDVERKIGEYCASLVEDESTLQVGIGSIPDAVCAALKDKKDLGVHTEMISDGLMDLWNAGVITNRKKSNYRGTMVAAFAYGSQKLYDFVDRNPAVTFKDVRSVNGPFKVAKCSKLVCINTCIEVDLMGQVVSSSSGLRQISGAGGQLDFIRGAAIALDGKAKAIVALTSTHEKNGEVTSRIKPFITEGSAVTVTRQDVDYFVTEYGIAHLTGKNLKDRARALIEIAHPDFRPELIADYERRFKSKY
ncbi:MAG: acetyl-CoA hydrolase/transferase family protein [Firmicutes bacterium]|nr:acetyl-CoA hydrolase/transferase family protein [Bacillota bacterium]